MENCVLITGAVRNTGLAVAKRFLREGRAVFITSRDAGEAARRAEELSSAFSAPCFGLGFSPLHAETEASRLFETIAGKGYCAGTAVCTAAALGLGQDALSCRPEDWAEIFFTNMTGYFSVARGAAREMIRADAARTGSIVFIGSINYRSAIPGRSAYVASKGGILSMTKGLAVDLAPHGIRVNCVLPGPIWTSRYDADPVKAAKKAEPVPLGRVSAAEEIAEAVYYLSSPASGNMTGAGLVIDGGLSSLSPIAGA